VLIKSRKSLDPGDLRFFCTIPGHAWEIRACFSSLSKASSEVSFRVWGFTTCLCGVFAFPCDGLSTEKTTTFRAVAESASPLNFFCLRFCSSQLEVFRLSPAPFFCSSSRGYLKFFSGLGTFPTRPKMTFLPSPDIHFSPLVFWTVPAFKKNQHHDLPCSSLSPLVDRTRMRTAIPGPFS